MGFFSGIVNAITSPVRAVTGLVSDVFSGKNLADSISKSIATNLGTLNAPNALTGNRLSKLSETNVPLLKETGGTFTATEKFSRGEVSRGGFLDFVHNAAPLAAVAVTGGAAGVAAGAGAYAVSKSGDLKSAIKGGLQAAGAGEAVDYAEQAKDFYDQYAGSGSADVKTTAYNAKPAAAGQAFKDLFTPTPGGGPNPKALMLFGVGAIAIFLITKGRK